jgi:exodeoxyribonuclease VII small subunit
MAPPPAHDPFVMTDKTPTRRSSSKNDDFSEWPIEKCFDELERIVTALEGETIPLEESLKLFERGMLLSRRCSTELGDIEKRIKIIIENTKGETQVKDFAPADDAP